MMKTLLVIAEMSEAEPLIRYYSMLKKDKVYKNIATYNIKKKIKKIVSFIDYKLYLILFK